MGALMKNEADTYNHVHTYRAHSQQLACVKFGSASSELSVCRDCLLFSHHTWAWRINWAARAICISASSQPPVSEWRCESCRPVELIGYRHHSGEREPIHANAFENSHGSPSATLAPHPMVIYTPNSKTSHSNDYSRFESFRLKQSQVPFSQYRLCVHLLFTPNITTRK